MANKTNNDNSANASDTQENATIKSENIDSAEKMPADSTETVDEAETLTDAQPEVIDAIVDGTVEDTAQDVEDTAQDNVDDIVPEFIAEISGANENETENHDEPLIKEVADRVSDFAENVHQDISEASNNLYQQFDPDKEHVFEKLEKPTAGSTMSTNTTPNYELVPSNAWPPPIYVSPDASSSERFYIEYRWHSQWAYYDSKASVSKKWHQRLQLVIGVGSVTVPVLVGFQLGDAAVQTVLQITTVIISLMVAAAAAIENVFTYGDNWRTFRSAAEELAREKAMYDMRSGPYRRAKNAFLLFTERCEDVIAKQNNAWTQMSEDKGDKDEDDDKNVSSSYSSTMSYTETSANYDTYDTSSEDIETVDAGAVG